MLVEWSDEFKFGVPMIDNDHQGLFQAVNLLADKISAADSGKELDIWQELNYLAVYVNEHFQREEQLMQEHNYPYYRAHVLQHRKIRRAVFAIRKMYATDPALLDPHKLINFFAGWLKNHIINDDLAYVPLLHASQYGRRKSDLADTISSERLKLGQERPVANEELVSVVVKVPMEAKEIIERCATMLRYGGADADDLYKFVDPLFGMTLEEAKQYAELWQ